MKLKKIVLLCVVIECVFLAGCKQKVNKEINQNAQGKIVTQTEEKTSENGVLCDYDFARVYDITRYVDGIEMFVPQYQYIVFNEKKNKIIDTGSINYYDPQFTQVADGIVKAEYGTGATDSWKGIYYDIKKEQKSEEFDCPFDEFGRNVVYYKYKGNKTYLVVSDMFNSKKIKMYRLSDDWLLPSLLKVNYKDGTLNVNYDGAEKQFNRKIILGDS